VRGEVGDENSVDIVQGGGMFGGGEGPDACFGGQDCVGGGFDGGRGGVRGREADYGALLGRGAKQYRVGVCVGSGPH
jgi:hypothetical protein